MIQRFAPEQALTAASLPSLTPKPGENTMAITLQDEVKKRLLKSIKRYFIENLEEDIGELKAILFLDFCLQEIGPSIYNQAVADAQAHLQEKLSDLENACYEPEFAYFKK